VSAINIIITRIYSLCVCVFSSQLLLWLFIVCCIFHALCGCEFSLCFCSFACLPMALFDVYRTISLHAN